MTPSSPIYLDREREARVIALGSQYKYVSNISTYASRFCEIDVNESYIDKFLFGAMVAEKSKGLPSNVSTLISSIDADVQFYIDNIYSTMIDIVSTLRAESLKIEHKFKSGIKGMIYSFPSSAEMQTMERRLRKLINLMNASDLMNASELQDPYHRWKYYYDASESVINESRELCKRWCDAYERYLFDKKQKYQLIAANANVAITVAKFAFAFGAASVGVPVPPI